METCMGLVFVQHFYVHCTETMIMLWKLMQCSISI